MGGLSEHHRLAWWRADAFGHGDGRCAGGAVGHHRPASRRAAPSRPDAVWARRSTWRMVDSVVASLEIITQIYLADGRVPERIGNRYSRAIPTTRLRQRTAASSSRQPTTSCGAWCAAPSASLHWPMTSASTTTRKGCSVMRRCKPPDRGMDCARARSTTSSNPCSAAGRARLSPINTVDRLVNGSPHIAVAREMFVDVEHPRAGTTPA